MSCTAPPVNMVFRVVKTSRAVLFTAALMGCSLGSSESGSGQASVRVAEAALNGGSPRIALQVAQNILARTPDDVPALLIRGDALTQLGQNDDAVGAFEHAMRRDPASAHAKLGLGRVRLTTDPAAAAGLFRDVLLTDASNASALTDLGIALDLLGQHLEARQYYQRVLHDNPGNVAVQVNLALSLAMTGDSAGALRLIEPLANDRTAPTKLRHNYAAILTMAGRETEAAEVLKQDLPPNEIRQAMAAYRQGTALTSANPIQPASAAAVPLPSTNGEQAALAATPPVVASQPEALPVVNVPSAPTETIMVTQTSAPLPAAPSVRPPFEIPVPATPAPSLAETVTATPSVARPASQLKATRHGPQVQLGAFNSEHAAKGEWRRLQRKVPALLAGREPAITTIERDGMTLWRLRTRGFSNQSKARSFCSKLRPATERCMVFGA